jgi:nitroreductase
MDAVFKRRSIRKFTDQPVKNEVIDHLLMAAMAAPSARNQQPWQFVIIDDRKLLDKVPDIHPYAQMAKEAPVAILVCADPSRQATTGYWIQDCAAATENILVEVAALDLGAVWCGVYPREERILGFRKLLGIPEDIIPFSFIPLGHPAEQKEPADRYDSTRIHHNGW